MSGRAQYGQLLRDAGRHILSASVELEDLNPDDREPSEAGPSGPLSGELSPSGPLSGELSPSGPPSGELSP